MATAETHWKNVGNFLHFQNVGNVSTFFTNVGTIQLLTTAETHLNNARNIPAFPKCRKHFYIFKM